MDLNLPKMRTISGPASLWKRVLAFILDLVLLDFFVFSPFGTLFSKVFGDTSKMNWSEYQNVAMSAGESGILGPALVTIGVTSLLYFAIMNWKTDQTFGMRIMNIKVEALEGELTFFRSIVRNLFILPIFPFFILWVIDPVAVFMNKNNQRLLEMATKTRVVENYQVL